ncbi:phosphomannomutase/phosphoglucomutase [Candidatus Uhrbacteria bacterium]|nr:phosphomannomutase/phosphoglucomutase [Candidatus Uhrbacteria bacterium]
MMDIFKAYDVRGLYPDAINEDVAYRIGYAFIEYLGRDKTIVIARDVRLSGPVLCNALSAGIVAAGGRIVDIGVVTTEMLYFAVAQYGYDGGVMVSASHNEGQYNGLKFVREGARAISSDTGLFAIRDLALKVESRKSKVESHLEIQKKEVLDDYVDYLLQKFAPKKCKPFRIVANANFGMAGNVLARLIERGKLPITVMPLDFEPNGAFPKGKPDPLIPERRQETEALVRKEKSDFGVAWDADADRCFFFDERGDFVEGYYTISLLATYLLARHPKEPMIYDVRFTWASRDTITAEGGVPIMMKPGHSFIKDRIQKEHALFAGENSGHYYFRDFFGVDSGMVPFLLLLDMLSQTAQPLSALADVYRTTYPMSGEVNSRVADADAIMHAVEKHYHDGTIEKIDGLSVEYPEWRFNLRKSNTEPLLRLCVEAKTDVRMKEKTGELLALIRS